MTTWVPVVGVEGDRQPATDVKPRRAEPSSPGSTTGSTASRDISVDSLTTHLPLTERGPIRTMTSLADMFAAQLADLKRRSDESDRIIREHLDNAHRLIEELEALDLDDE